jgi:hypothetical protein
MSESNICGDGLSSYAGSSNTSGGTDREKFLAIRKTEAAKIDPAVAEVTWVYAQTLDPYGVYEPPEEDDQIGREYFARNPGSEIWVHFDDLPDPIRDRLWKTHRAALEFPAGLFDRGEDLLSNSNDRSFFGEFWGVKRGEIEK